MTTAQHHHRITSHQPAGLSCTQTNLINAFFCTFTLNSRGHREGSPAEGDFNDSEFHCNGKLFVSCEMFYPKQIDYFDWFTQMRHPSHTHNHSFLCILSRLVLVLAVLLLLLFYSGAPESFSQGRQYPSAGYGQGYKVVVVVEPIQKTKTDSRAEQSTCAIEIEFRVHGHCRRVVGCSWWNIIINAR